MAIVLRFKITHGTCKGIYKRVYTPQGVEQVMDVAGLPGLIIHMYVKVL